MENCLGWEINSKLKYFELNRTWKMNNSIVTNTILVPGLRSNATIRRIGFLVWILIFSWMSGCSSKDGKRPVQKADTSSRNISAQKSKPASDSKDKIIIFYGNSLTAGYGLDDPNLAFPGLVQHKIDSLHLPYKVINAGLSGETTAGGLGRIDWILREPVDIFVLELGGNDGLRGIPVSETYKNLQSIIDKVSAKYPPAKIILAGMLAPPNMGRRYTSEFRGTFKRLADKNKLLFIPFLLESVGGEPGLNQSDGIHPNLRGHQIVAENVWKILAPVL